MCSVAVDREYPRTAPALLLFAHLELLQVRRIMIRLMHYNRMIPLWLIIADAVPDSNSDPDGNGIQAVGLV
jgi:hypothetical protein